MEYTFRGKVSVDDYVQFFQQVTHSRPSYIFFAIVCVALCILMLSKSIPAFDFDEVSYFINYKGELALEDKIQFLWFCIYHIYPIVYLVLPRIFNKIIVPKISHIAYFSDKYIQEVCEYRVNENEILINSEMSHTVLNKNTIFKIKRNKTSVYLYSSAYRAFIIKKHYFDNANEFKELASFIMKHYA